MSSPSFESADQKLARGLGIVATFATLCALARLALDAAITWKHGLSAEVDAYLFSLNLITWPAGVMLSCLTLLVTPIEAALRKHHADQIELFRAELLGWTLLATALAMPLGLGALWWAAHGSWSGLSPDAARAAAAGVWQLAPALPVALLIALASAWMVAASRHEMTLTEAIPPLLLSALLLVLPQSVLYGGTSMALVLQLLVLVILLQREGELPWPRWQTRSVAWRHINLGALALVLSTMLFTTLPLIDQLFAARLPEGTLTALALANRLILGLLGFSALVLQRTALPLLSGLHAQSPRAMNQAVLYWSVLAAALASGLAALIAWLAEPIIALLYQRGAFSEVHSREVADLLRWGLLQLPLSVAGALLVAAAAASHALRDIAWAACAGLLVKLLSSALLTPWLGAAGLQLATALTCLTTSVWLASALRMRRLPPNPNANAMRPTSLES